MTYEESINQDVTVTFKACDIEELVTFLRKLHDDDFALANYKRELIAEGDEDETEEEAEVWAGAAALYAQQITALRPVYASVTTIPEPVYFDLSKKINWSEDYLIT